MTIIQPHKETNIKRFLIFLFATLLCGGLVYIYEYNKFVDTRYETQSIKKSILVYQTANAELKNKLYKELDPAYLRDLATQQGLIIEKHPQYITKN